MYRIIIGFFLFISLTLWIYVYIKNNNFSYEGFANNEDLFSNNYLSSLNANINNLNKSIDTANNKTKKKGKNATSDMVNKLTEIVFGNEIEKQKKRQTIKPPPKKNNKLTIPRVTKNLDKIIKPHNTECKFMSSFSESYNCPENYSSHLGAVFGAKASSGISCNGKQVKAERAKAYCIVRDGGVEKIKLTSNGNNYHNIPKIVIRGGNGKGAKARAVLDNDTSIKSIKILHKGSGYTQTPKIIISKPDGHVYCHLCCSLPPE